VDDDGTADYVAAFDAPAPRGEDLTDLLVLRENVTTLTLLANDGRGGFREGAEIQTAVLPKSFSVADLDADGRDDVVVAGSLGRIRSFLQTDEGDFALADERVAGTLPSIVVTGHLDEDEHVDMTVAHRGTTILHVFHGQGDGTFLPRPDAYDTLGTPVALVVADWNDDTRDDLAILNSRGRRSLLLLTGDDGVLDAIQSIEPPDDPVSATAVESAPGGGIDLAICRESEGRVLVFPGGGDGTFDESISPTPSTFSGSSSSEAIRFLPPRAPTADSIRPTTTSRSARTSARSFSRSIRVRVRRPRLGKKRKTGHAKNTTKLPPAQCRGMDGTRGSRPPRRRHERLRNERSPAGEHEGKSCSSDGRVRRRVDRPHDATTPLPRRAPTRDGSRASTLAIHRSLRGQAPLGSRRDR